MPETPLTFKSQGQQISGVLHLPEKIWKAPAIIMVHGFMGDKQGTPSGLFVKAARKLVNSGYAVFRFDFRGSGDSEGDFENQNLDTEFQDLDVAINFVSGLKEVDKNRIGLVGHSRGGFLSITQASKDSRIKAAVCWAPAVFFKPLWEKTAYERKLAKSILEKGHAINYWGFKFTKQLLDTDFRYDNNIEGAKKIKIPVRIIHGKKDTAVPLSQSRKLYRALKCEKDLSVMEKANHIFTDEKDFENLLRLTETWFGKRL